MIIEYATRFTAFSNVFTHPQLIVNIHTVKQNNINTNV